MRPTLEPGDGVIGVAIPRVRTGELRVVEHPQRPGLWLVKRVGAVEGRGADCRFEAVSDNAVAVGVVDSRRLGLLRAAGSYRVIRVLRGVRETA